MVKRVVIAGEIRGSAIHKYADDVAWWSRASGQPATSVKVETRPPSGDVERVVIDFPNEAVAETFEAYLEGFGVRVLRDE